MHLQNVLLRSVKILRKEQNNVFFDNSKVRSSFSWNVSNDSLLILLIQIYALLNITK